MATLSTSQVKRLDEVTLLQLVLGTLFVLAGVLLNLAWLLKLLPEGVVDSANTLWLCGLGGGTLILLALCVVQGVFDKKEYD